MTMKAAIDEVGVDVKAAMDAAAVAYDTLITELKNGSPDPDIVLKQSEVMCTSSLRVWANLLLAPAKLAAVIVSEETT